jgi:branched-chain amino acid transport system permease protein
VLLENFAAELVSRERFNLVIGITFMLIVSISRDGLLGIFRNLATRLSKPSAIKSQTRFETGPRKST